MKIIFSEKGVKIESDKGIIDGDTLLHYHVAKTLIEAGKPVSDLVIKNDRTIVVKHPIEEDFNEF